PLGGRPRRRRPPRARDLAAAGPDRLRRPPARADGDRPGRELGLRRGRTALDRHLVVAEVKGSADAARANEAQLAPLLRPGRCRRPGRGVRDLQRPRPGHVDDLLALGDLDEILAEDAELADRVIGWVDTGVDAGVGAVIGGLPAVAN